MSEMQRAPLPQKEKCGKKNNVHRSPLLKSMKVLLKSQHGNTQIT